MKWDATRQITFFILVSLGLLVVGLAIDLGFTRPRMDEIRRLHAQRSQFQAKAVETAAHEREGRELARFFHADDPKSALEANQQSDPLSVLGRALERSRLTRQELSVQSVAQSGKLRRTRVTMQVLGSYGGIVDLARVLEQGPRVITIDAISVGPAEAANLLEGRFDVSIFDLGEKRRQ